MAEKTKKPVKHRFLKRMFLTIVLFIMTTGIVGTLYVYMNLRSLPKVDAQSMNTYGTIKILDKNNDVIWQPTDKHVGIMKPEEIPDLYGKTLVAVEDGDFWKNKGYSIKGIANMILTTIASKVSSVEARGGSTIEQQLIKNVYFKGGYTMKTTTRKIQEIYLARQLDANFSKKQILTFYVNNLSFAEGDVGASSVMMTYFGKTPEDYKTRSAENIAQLAYIAGLGQNPTIFNMYTNPEAATKRAHIVLGVMKENKLITKSEYKDAMAIDLPKTLKPRFWEATEQQAKNAKYATYTAAALRQVKELGYNPDKVTLTIKTFLDPVKYEAIQATVRKGQFYQDGNEQGAATVMSANGVVVGMVGSRTPDSELNRALQRTRSSGSSLKPFTAYGPLLQYMGNQYNTASTFSSAPYRYPGTNKYMNNWGKFSYGNVNMQSALRQSLNTVVGRIDDNILGSARMKAFLAGVGLDVKDSYSAIDGIGLYISTLDAAAAWNAINNGGIYTEPRFVDTITFSDDSVKKIAPKSHRAMNASTAFVLSQMLRGVLAPGQTGADAAIGSYSGYAGKTGTVGFDASSKSPATYGTGGSDAWFNSITNGGYAISIWQGYDEPNKSPQVSDNFKGPQTLSRALQLQMNGNKSIANWRMPNGVRPIGGSNLSAHYAVTDSADLNSQARTSTVNISKSYNDLDDIKSVNRTVVDKHWMDNVDNKAFYHLYQQNPDVLNDTGIINEAFYNVLEGGE